MGRVSRVALVTSVMVLVPAASAAAHGLAGRADLPLPRGMFLWGATAVLVLSFLALALLWSTPLLQDATGRVIWPGVGRLLTHPVVDAVCGAIGVALLGVSVWSALWGTWPADLNFAVVFVFVIFWVGLLPVTVLLGNVYAAFNPWRAIGRAFGWVVGRWAAVADGSLPYPPRLGYWPAVAGLFAFGWLELAHTTSAPALGVAIIVYSLAQFAGMGLFGVEPWVRRGDAFAVYFELLSRVSPFVVHGRQLLWRRPLSALTTWPTEPGAAALLVVAIGTVTFDGAREGPVWQQLLQPQLEFWSGLGAQNGLPIELAAGTGLIAGIGIAAALYWGGARRSGESSAGEVRRRFAHTLVPIVIAYAGAHYFSLLVYTGQRIVPVVSDPLGRGWDLFGTAGVTVDYGVIQTEGIWWVMLSLVVVGHVLALTLAHDRALALFADARAAIRSQVWMLAAMVAFTLLALYLLHTMATSD